eukprot:scaffold112068_cov49-Attheya_sp.AAC.2
MDDIDDGRSVPSITTVSAVTRERRPSPSLGSLPLLAFSVTLRSRRDEATVFSPVDSVNLSHSMLDAASSGGSNAGRFAAIRVISLFRFSVLSVALRSGRGGSF